MSSKRVRESGLAAIYARVSTERQAIGDRTSLDRQVKNCERTAAKLGLTVTPKRDHIIKESHSASDPEDRPGLERLYAGAAREQFRYVNMDLIDRTTRGGPFDFVDICRRFQRCGVEPIWANHPEWDLADPHDQAEAMKEAADAFRDKETIARRFQEGKGERIENGLLIRSYIAYGYKWNAERPRYRAEYDDDDQDPRTAWVLDDAPREDKTPPPADVVARIFSYLATGWRTNSDASADKLAEMLTDEGIPTPSQVKRLRRRADRWQGQAALWRMTTITYVVHNPTYKGTRPNSVGNRRRATPRNARQTDSRRTG